MPELPEVETVRRGLAPALVGARIERVGAAPRRPALPLPRALRRAARRASTVTALSRRAKYLLAELVLGRGARHASRHDRPLPRGPRGRRSSLRATSTPSRAAAAPTTTSCSTSRTGPSSPTTTCAASASWTSCPARSSRPAATSPGWASSRSAASCRERRSPASSRDGARRSRPRCSISGSSPASATSTSARPCSGPGCIRRRPPARSRPRRASRRGRPRRLARIIVEVLEEAVEAGGSTLRDYARTDGSLGLLPAPLPGLRPRRRGLRQAGLRRDGWSASSRRGAPPSTARPVSGGAWPRPAVRGGADLYRPIEKGGPSPPFTHSTTSPAYSAGVGSSAGAAPSGAPSSPGPL